MGQFLATGILAQFSVKAKDVQKIDADEATALTKIQQAVLHTSNAHYEVTKHDDYYTFKVKTALLEKELIPFLTDYYADYYGEKTHEYPEVLSKLAAQPSFEKWEAMAEEKEYECFQLDDYGHLSRRIEGEYIHISPTLILLSLEGKIRMESYGQHFTFFEKALTKMYAKYEVANLVKVYITG